MKKNLFIVFLLSSVVLATALEFLHITPELKCLINVTCNCPGMLSSNESESVFKNEVQVMDNVELLELQIAVKSYLDSYEFIRDTQPKNWQKFKINVFTRFFNILYLIQNNIISEMDLDKLIAYLPKYDKNEYN